MVHPRRFTVACLIGLFAIAGVAFTAQTPEDAAQAAAESWLKYDTVFANKASAVETVIPMAEPDGAWRMSAYSIR